MKLKYWNEITTPEDIADACELAADFLEGHWTQGSWYKEDTDQDEDGFEVEAWFYCIEGALAAAIGLDAQDMDQESKDRGLLLQCPVYEAVTETLNLRQGKEGMEQFCVGELPTWNDAGGTTEQDALDLLHATAKRVLGVEA
jgi:hypothetical protein